MVVDMKAFIFAMCTWLIVITHPLSAQCFTILNSPYLELGAGYRNDYVSWKGDRLFPSHFKIKDVSNAKINAKFETKILAFFLIRADADYGWILDGRKIFNRFDSYNSHIFNNQSKLKGDHVYDYSFSLGINLDLSFCPPVKIIPLFGYSYHFQKYKLKNKDDSSSCSYSNFGLIESYKAKWRGPWVGIGLDWYFIEDFLISFEYQFHWTSFHGRLNLDHSNCDESFHKSHHGRGNVAKVNFAYLLCSGWEIGIAAAIQNWNAHGHGSGSSSSSSSSSSSRTAYIKEAKWNSYEVNLNIGYLF
jgi:hypothetical protein